MPTAAATSADALVDTSIAVPLVLAKHPLHAAARAAVGSRVLGLSGHAEFETYSVITRLPAPHKLSPATTFALLCKAFPGTAHLGARRGAALLEAAARDGIAGGAIFDALVGAAALEAGLPLISRDRRAQKTYALLGVTIEFADF